MSVCAHWTRVGTSKAFTSSCLVGPVRRSASVVCNAKKKGKKGGKKQKGSLLDIPKKSQIQPWQTTEIIMQHLLLVESYRCDVVLGGKCEARTHKVCCCPDVRFPGPGVPVCF